MATLEEKQQLVQDVLDLVCDRVDGGEDVAEVMLNAFSYAGYGHDTARNDERDHGLLQNQPGATRCRSLKTKRCT